MAAKLAGSISLAAIIHARAAPIVQYNFSRETCLEGVSENLGTGGAAYFGTLVLNSSVYDCLDGTGVKGNGEATGWPIASSVGNISALKTEITSQTNGTDWPGLSFELWFSLGNPTCDEDPDNMCLISLLTFGADPEGDDTCGKTTDLEIYYDRTVRYLKIRILHSLARSTCAVLPCSYTVKASDYPVHLVLLIGAHVRYSIYDYIDLTWYLNGTQVYYYITNEVTAQEMVADWREGYQLHLLDRRREELNSWDQDDNWPFEGTLFGAAIYIGKLSAERILAIFNEGVVESDVFVYNQTVQLAEDGEDGDHYDTPEYYLQEIPWDELYSINIDAYDADNERSNPNYPLNIPAPKVFVTSIPLTGELINSSGDVQILAPFEVIGIDDGYPVKYRPLRDDAKNSTVYANFTYYAVDGRNGARTSSATVTIYVYAKNDPPTAFANSSLAYAGISENIVHLYGEDYEEFDFLTGAMISVLPGRGTLYQVFDNGSASNVTISEWDSLWREAIAYRYDNRELYSNGLESQIVGDDTFGFVVLDSDARYSVTATIDMTVLSGVWALPYDGLWLCYEETECDVYFYGNALLQEEEVNMSVTITKAPTYGHFLDDGTNSSIVDESMLSTRDYFPWSNGVHAIYRGVTHFFTSPDVTWTGEEITELLDKDTMSYAMSIHVGDAVLTSESVEHYFKVININDYSKINCSASQEYYSILSATNLFDDENGTIARPDEVTFTNISISEKDYGVDPLLVAMVVDEGFMNFDEYDLTLLDFSWSCDDHVNINCQGDGDQDTDPIFKGQPKDVEQALNNIVFSSYSTSYVANVSITLYDGRNGKCLSTFEAGSVRPSCEESTCSFQIEVGEKYNWIDEDGVAFLTISWYWALVVLTFLSWLALKIFFWVMGKIVRITKSLFLLYLRLRKYGLRKGWRIQPSPANGDEPGSTTSIIPAGLSRLWDRLLNLVGHRRSVVNEAREGPLWHLRMDAIQDKRSTSSRYKLSLGSLFNPCGHSVAVARPSRGRPLFHLRGHTTQDKRSTSSSPRPLWRSLFDLDHHRLAVGRVYRRGPEVQAVLPASDPGPRSPCAGDI